MKKVTIPPDAICVEPSPKQLEDWTAECVLKRLRQPNVMEFRFEFAHLEPAQFEKAYQALIVRHESLRTTFPRVDGRVRQLIHEYTPARYGLHLVTQGVEQPPSPNEIARRFKLKMRNLEEGPLVRSILVKTPGQKYVFICLVHHIICDLWSVNLLQEELTALYKGLLAGNENPLPPVSSQLKDYLHQQSARLDEANERNLHYWQQQLAAGGWEFNYDALYDNFRKSSYRHTSRFGNAEAGPRRQYSPADLVRDQRGERYAVVLKGPLFDRISNYRATRKVNLLSVVTAGLNLLGHKLAGNEKLLIRSHYFNRHAKETRSIVGNFIGSMLWYNTIDGELSVDAFVSQVYKAFVKSVARVLVSTERLSEHFAVITQSFLYINYFSKEMLGGQTDDQPGVSRGKATIDSPAACNIYEYPDAIRFEWVYNLNFFDVQCIRYMLDEFFQLLERMFEHPEQPIKQILYRPLQPTGSALTREAPAAAPVE